MAKRKRKKDSIDSVIHAMFVWNPEFLIDGEPILFNDFISIHLTSYTETEVIDAIFDCLEFQRIRRLVELNQLPTEMLARIDVDTALLNLDKIEQRIRAYLQDTSASSFITDINKIRETREKYASKQVNNGGY